MLQGRLGTGRGVGVTLPGLARLGEARVRTLFGELAAESGL